MSPEGTSRRERISRRETHLCESPTNCLSWTFFSSISLRVCSSICAIMGGWGISWVVHSEGTWTSTIRLRTGKWLVFSYRKLDRL